MAQSLVGRDGQERAPTFAGAQQPFAADVFGFALGVFGRYQAPRLAALAGRLMLAEVLKLAYTGALFLTVIVAVRPLSPIALFLAYLAVQLVPALLAAWADRQKKS